MTSNEYEYISYPNMDFWMELFQIPRLNVVTEDQDKLNDYMTFVDPYEIFQPNLLKYLDK